MCPMLHTLRSSQSLALSRRLKLCLEGSRPPDKEFNWQGQNCGRCYKKSRNHTGNHTPTGVYLQATQAYLVGNKALAKELGAKGRHHSDEMKAAHAAASETIFQQRNLRNAASAVSNKNGEIAASAQDDVYVAAVPMVLYQCDRLWKQLRCLAWW